MKPAAKFISYLCHPVIFILLSPFLIMFRESHNIFYALSWVFFSSVFLGIVLITFYILHPEEFMTDFDIAKKENRIVFYAIGCVMTLIYFFIAVIFKGIFFPLTIVSIGVLLGLVLLEITNLYIKVSIHVAVVCAYVVMLGILYGVNIFLLFWWLIPLVAWARLYLRKHTFAEIMSGAFIGFLVSGIIFSIEKMIL